MGIWLVTEVVTNGAGLDDSWRTGQHSPDPQSEEP